MLEVTREIVTDVTVRSTGKSVIAKQNDTGSRFLNVRIQESGKPVDIVGTASVIFNVLRPDGLIGEFSGTVNNDGTVRVGLTSWILGQAGIVSCDISIVDDTAKLTTMTFYIEVEPAVCSDEDIEEVDEYNVIVELLNQTQEACEKANAAANQAAEAAEQSVKTVRDCEEATKLAEDAASGVVTIEQNSQTQLRFWVGTKAEYDALEEKVQGCFYIISDDEGKEKIYHRLEALERNLDVVEQDLDVAEQNLRMVEQNLRIVERDNADSIIERGEIGIWYYEKFKSGVIKLYGFLTTTVRFNEKSGCICRSVDNTFPLPTELGINHIHCFIPQAGGVSKAAWAGQGYSGVRSGRLSVITDVFCPVPESMGMPSGLEVHFNFLVVGTWN